MKFTHEHFDGKGHPGNRRIEGGSYPGSGTAGNQVPDPFIGKAEELADR